MPPLGRPPVGPPIQIRLPRLLLDAVDRHAAEHGLSRAAAVRRLLSQALGHDEAPRP